MHPHEVPSSGDELIAFQIRPNFDHLMSVSGMGHVIDNCHAMTSADCYCDRDLGLGMIHISGEYMPHRSDLRTIL
nr:hypothetical transcript [Hymenolepis microstoma]CUU98775.1 hypothetical transcript [Hymenolepis microstoma]